MLLIPKMLCPELRKLSKKQAKSVWKIVIHKYQMRSLYFLLLVYAFLTLIITLPWFGPMMSPSVSDTRFYICSISVSIIAVTSTFLFFRGKWRDEVTKEIKKLESIPQENIPIETPDEKPNPHTA